MPTRRDFLKLAGSSALLAALASKRARAARPRPPATASAVIVLWMNGGPSHLDTWDPKPGAKGGGPFKPIATRVPGLSICEHLPRLAERADRLTILRGMTSREGNHDRASHLLHTGYVPNPTVQHPALGAWVAEEIGDPKADLPAFVAVGGPSAGAGFLGVQHGPFVVPRAGQPPGDTSYPRGVDFTRFLRRKEALSFLERRFEERTGDAKVQARREVYDRSVRMMYAPRLRAFDLDDESAATRASYGDSDFGRGCLLARRLVENGVKFVEVVLDGWDTHQNGFARTEKLMAQLDPAMAALLDDLSARALLQKTIVVCAGEFGRTPTVNANEGRDHHPAAWSAVVAGGGFRGGLAWGATDGEGGKVVERPTPVGDLFATVASQLGIDPGKELQTPSGRPLAIADGKRIPELVG